MSRDLGLLSLFPTRKFIIAMIHLKGRNRDDCLARAIRETEQYFANGVDAILVENYYGSVPDCEAFLEWLQANRPDCLYGVNVLQQLDVSLALAAKYGAKFVQEDSVCGHLAPPDEEKWLAHFGPLIEGRTVPILGGVRFKYQSVLSGRTVEEDLRIGMTRCDAIVVTGEGTGLETDVAKIRQFREVIGDFPLIVGAGLDPENAAFNESLTIADGGIVGSWVKVGHDAGGDVKPAFVQRFMAKVRQLR
jgi:predicted TIM-barrel enzyme